MMNDQQEEILREKYCDKYRKIKNIRLYKEIPVFSRSVDLVQYDLKANVITAIEFKINDWKRAIKQLENVAMCFDYIVLCIPKPKTEKCVNNIKTACDEKGIGLCFWDDVNDLIHYECQPKQIIDIWNIQRRQIIAYLDNRED